MAILNNSIDSYLADLLPERDDILNEMEQIAREKNFPIVGPQVGRVLMQYTILKNAKRIFELGSGYGYSAMWFAKSSQEDTEIYCTDGSEKNKNMAESFFERAEVIDKINFLVGDAVTQLKRVDGVFDIIYCDINKDGYPEAYDASIPRLNKRGLLIADNTLWSGRVVDKYPDKSTKGILEYNKKAFSDERVISTILPIRDGLCVSLKL